jgi:hypothetical protein
MKAAVKIYSAVMAVSLLFAGAAFAKSSKGPQKGTIHLNEAVTVEGKQLSPGDYKIETDNSGPQASVNIIKGKDTIASIPAHVQPSSPEQENGYGIRTEPDGSKQLTVIILHRTEYDLSTGQSGARAGANAPNEQQ